MAEALFRHMLDKENLTEKISVDSAGTGDWHIGNPPHEGTLNILEKYQISAKGLKARQFQQDDLHTFHYVVAMDEQNVADIKALSDANPSAKVFRLLDLVGESDSKDVPDPYFTGDFEETYDLVSKGCRALLHLIKKEHQI